MGIDLYSPCSAFFTSNDSLLCKKCIHLKGNAWVTYGSAHFEKGYHYVAVQEKSQIYAFSCEVHFYELSKWK